MSEAKKKQRKKHMDHRIRNHGRDILESAGFRDSQNSIQHGSVSVREHSIAVAGCALAISDALPFSFHERDIVRGALLHDYFLYDWHTHKIRLQSPLRFYELHGFSHPKTALANAKKEFRLSRRQEDIIVKHMWPLTIAPPACREAWVVTVADKYCSLLETLHIRKGEHR